MLYEKFIVTHGTIKEVFTYLSQALWYCRRLQEQGIEYELEDTAV
jgi:hypothetical protein